MCNDCGTKQSFDMETEEVSMPRKGISRAATEAPIAEALNSYDFKLEELAELVALLDSKLDPIISSTHEAVDRDYDRDSDIADRHGKLSFSIMEKNERLAKLSGKIRRIINNLEL